MISHQRLPGRANQVALNGISDWFGMPTWVKQYWQSIKHRIKEIVDTGYKISLYQQKIAVAHHNLVQKGDMAGANALKDELAKIDDDLKKWWKVKGYIDTYLSQWMQLDQNVAIQPSSGVSAVPFVLAGMALTALAYVVNVGMALVQDYAYKSQLTQAVIDRKIAAGEMRDILSIPKEEGVFEKAIGKVGTGLGVGVPAALLIAGGAYLLWTTGVLRGITGMFSGSSQQSGG